MKQRSKIYNSLYYSLIFLLIFVSSNIFNTSNENNPSKFQDETVEFTHILPINDLKISANGDGYDMNLNADYSWIEISSSGTNMTEISNEDDDYQVLDIFAEDGWNFTFYETNYSKIYVSSNGWMSFTNKGDTEDWLYGIPSQCSENEDCIALLCEDLNLDDFDFGGGDVFYNFSGTAPNRYLVIEYYQAYDFSNEELVGDFEVILYENGTIKFQYKTVNDLDRFEPIIGLDHGDMTNYNLYDATLPLTSNAISFVFNELKDVNYSLDFNKNDQFSWKIDEINHTAMEKVFGTEWEQKFGLLPDMGLNEKTKINISLIKENSTHWEIKYELWNWTSPDQNFGAKPDVDPILFFRKEPLNYTQKHNLTNFIPLLLPKYTALYLRNANLSESYSNSTNIRYYWHSGMTEFRVNFLRPFTSDWIRGDVTYNENGILDEVDLNLWSGGVEYPAFAMSLITPSPGGGSSGGGGDDDDKDKDTELDIMFIILMVSIIGVGAFAVIVVLIKKGIIDLSKTNAKTKSHELT